MIIILVQLISNINEWTVTFLGSAFAVSRAIHKLEKKKHYYIPRDSHHKLIIERLDANNDATFESLKERYLKNEKDVVFVQHESYSEALTWLNTPQRPPTA